MEVVVCAACTLTTTSWMLSAMVAEVVFCSGVINFGLESVITPKRLPVVLGCVSDFHLVLCNDVLFQVGSGSRASALPLMFGTLPFVGGLVIQTSSNEL